MESRIQLKMQQPRRATNIRIQTTQTPHGSDDAVWVISTRLPSFHSGYYYFISVAQCEWVSAVQSSRGAAADQATAHSRCEQPASDERLERADRSWRMGLENAQRCVNSSIVLTSIVLSAHPGGGLSMDRALCRARKMSPGCISGLSASAVHTATSNRSKPEGH